MEQLLKITTTPIKLAFKVERGAFEEVKPDVVEINARRVQASLNNQSSQEIAYRPQPTMVKNDAVNISNSIKVSLPINVSGMNAEMLQQMNSSEVNNNTMAASSLVQNRVTASNSNNVAYVSGTGDATKWQPSQGMLDMNIELDTSALNDPSFKFVPGSISIEVEQYPSIKIEYLGGPIYVPKSADPNYKGDK